MRIGIDARFVGPEGTGLGKYTEKLILNLFAIDKNNQYVIFLRKKNWDYLNVKNKNFQKSLADVPWYSFSEQIKMPGIYKKANLDLLHIPHFNAPLFYNGKFIVTIHDLIHHHFKEQSATTRNELSFKIKRLGYHFVIRSAVLKSKKIIVPSNFIKGELLEIYKIEPSKIIVTYEAAEEEYFINHKDESKVSKPFIIYVGNVYPHKNLNRLLDAINLIKNVELFIVCPRDIFQKRLEYEIEKRNLSKRIKIYSYLESGELTKLFVKAKAYVSPSLAEGFGIPGLNAMAANIPVIASEIPALKEVYGDAALYFNPNDPKNIASIVQKVLTDSKTSSTLVERGKVQVKKYSWKRMATETLSAYKSLV